jgi:hypothetical protein
MYMVREYNVRDEKAFKEMESQFKQCANFLSRGIKILAGATNYKLVMEDQGDKWTHMSLPYLVKEERKKLGPFSRTKRTTMISVIPAMGCDCSFSIMNGDPYLDDDLKHIANEAEMMYKAVSINLVKI